MPNGNGRDTIVAQMRESIAALRQWKADQVQYLLDLGIRSRYYISDELPMPELEKDFNESHYTIAGLRHAADDLAKRQADWKAAQRKYAISRLHQGYIRVDQITPFFENAGLEPYAPTHGVSIDANITFRIPQVASRAAARGEIHKAILDVLDKYAADAGKDPAVSTTIYVNEAQ